MNWKRIRAMLLYSWYHMSHSMETWIDLFWFSLISLVVFGLMTQYLGGFDQAQLGAIMVGYLVWEVVRVGQYSVSIGIMWDVWSRSLSGLFVSPLKAQELFLASMLASVVKVFLVCTLASLLAWLAFGFWVGTLGWMLLVYAVILMIFAWATGLFIIGLIIRFGTAIQSLAWGLIFLYQPISALYYPVSVLPASIAWLSYLSPVTYVMETIRIQLAGGSMPWHMLGIGVLVSIGYFVVCSAYLWWSLHWAKKTGGFARLES